MAVHFTGPILFAGKDSPRKWFENLPVDKNPDFVTYMDDFTGIALDTTNDWTVVKDSSATAALGADAESGPLVLTSQAAMLTAADRIVFQVDDGDTNIDCVTEKDGTATTTDSGVDISDDTYVTLGFHVSDDAKVEFFVDRNLVATHTANIPDDENLTIGAMELSGSATGTKSATIDYLFASQNR